MNLSALKDIHLPAPEAWWILAWGWWALLGLIVLLIVMLMVYWRHIQAWLKQRRARKALRQAVQKELAHMRMTYAENHDALLLLSAVSMLLRRISLSVFGVAASAGLIGHEWLHFLDSKWAEEPHDNAFSSEINEDLLQYGAYKHKIDENMQLNIEELLNLTEKWAAKVVKYYV